MGELHLEIIVDRLLREFKVSANVGKPQVAYRETITANAEADGSFVRQGVGKNQFGVCTLEVAPNEKGAGLSLRVQCGHLKSLLSLSMQFEKVPKTVTRVVHSQDFQWSM